MTSKTKMTGILCIFTASEKIANCHSRCSIRWWMSENLVQEFGLLVWNLKPTKLGKNILRAELKFQDETCCLVCQHAFLDWKCFISDTLPIIIFVIWNFFWLNNLIDIPSPCLPCFDWENSRMFQPIKTNLFCSTSNHL